MTIIVASRRTTITITEDQVPMYVRQRLCLLNKTQRTFSSQVRRTAAMTTRCRKSFLCLGHRRLTLRTCSHSSSSLSHERNEIAARSKDTVYLGGLWSGE